MGQWGNGPSPSAVERGCDRPRGSLRAVGREGLWRWRLREQPFERGAPAAREQVSLLDEPAPQVSGHRADKDLVLTEVPPRGVEHRRPTGNVLRDDAQAGAGDD